MRNLTIYIIFIFAIFSANKAYSQSYEIILKGGHVIDPKNEINDVLDIAVKDGQVARVADDIPISLGERIIDVSGLYVTPGMIDLHTHLFHGTVPGNYLNNSFSALPPDGFTFRAGVTTAVDVGGTGWKDFGLFKDQVIDRSQTRVLSFLNIVGGGMRPPVPYEQDLNDMDPTMTALVANQHSEIVGVKVAHYRNRDWTPYERGVAAGNLAEIPVMVDFGGANPALSIDSLFFDVLRPGDIYTHAFGGGMTGHGDREAIIDENDRLRPRMHEAQERGIIFDVGFGGGSFFYDVAIPATKQNFWPNTFGTDLHTGSMNGGMKTMLNVASTMMNLGMSLQEVINASTWKPAQVIQREDLGHLSVGAEADIAVFNLLNGDFGFQDSRRIMIPGNEKLEAELTLRAGRVVWDLNGIASPQWGD
ncbi:MAG: amidohydrolase/deacetylase family metallohydrolase [Balneolaceae bacterium]